MLLNKDPPDVFVKGRPAYCQASPSSRCLRQQTFMHTAVLALPPQGAAGGADKTHARMKRLARAGAARRPAAALLNPTDQTNVHPGESNDRLQHEGSPAR